MVRIRTMTCCLTLVLALVGCTVSPQNGQRLGATDEPLSYSGFTTVPGQRVHVQVRDR